MKYLLKDEAPEDLLPAVAGKYHTPFYLFDYDRFSQVLQSVKAQLGDTGMCYAMKANPFLLRRADEGADRIEVCSTGEYRIARKMKVTPEKLLISGVVKRPEDLEMILNDLGGSCMYTAESRSQYEQLALWAQSKKTKLRIFVRLTSGNQFGVDRDTLMDIMEDAAQKEYIELQGIHFFPGTMRKKPDSVRRELAMLDELLLQLETEKGIKLPELEYGPGIPVTYFPKRQYPEVAVYLTEIKEALTQMKWQGRATLEMGRALAGTCGYYVTQIRDIKTNDDTHYCLVDGGIHQLNYDGQMRGMCHPHISVVRNCSKGEETQLNVQAEDVKRWTIAGSLCTTNDILVADMPLGELQVGDHLIFANTGAYSALEGMALFLSHELPDILGYSKAGGVEELRTNIETWIFNMPERS